MYLHCWLLVFLLLLSLTLSQHLTLGQQDNAITQRDHTPSHNMHLSTTSLHKQQSTRAQRQPHTHQRYSLTIHCDDSYSISSLPSKTPLTLLINIIDTQSNTSVLLPGLLRPLDTRVMHIMVVPATYDALFHLHLEDFHDKVSTQSLLDTVSSIELSFPYAGNWVIGINLWPKTEVTMITLHTQVTVISSIPHIRPQLQQTQSLQSQHIRAYPFEVQERYTHPVLRSSNQVTDQQNSLSSSYYVDVLINGGQPIPVNVCVPIILTVKEADHKDTTQLLPYLTLPVHLLLLYYPPNINHVDIEQIIIKHQHGRVLHNHSNPVFSCAPMIMSGTTHAGMTGGSSSMDMEVLAMFGPSVASAALFSHTGRWLLAAQFKHQSKSHEHGELLTVLMDVIVHGTAAATHSR